MTLPHERNRGNETPHYGFDTGFVSYYSGWQELRPDDLGILWEHYVLNELHAQLRSRAIRYWRDKNGHEVDFVMAQRGADPIVIECKWKRGSFDSRGVAAFRRHYPQGRNFVVAADVTRRAKRDYAGLDVEFVSLSQLVESLKGTDGDP